MHRQQNFSFFAKTWKERDNWNWYALSITENFILLASSDNDNNMPIRKKNVKKDSPTTWEMTICQVKTGLGVNQFSKAKVRKICYTQRTTTCEKL